MRTKALPPTILAAALGALGALGAFAAHGQHEHSVGPPAASPRGSPPQSSGFYLPQPIPLAPFTLVDQHAKAFTRTGLEGRWTLLVFGYTHCPDVCPITLAQVSETRALLRKEAPGLKLGTVFVTIDPQRDTPTQIAPYVAAFDEALIGLTGSADDIAAFADQFRVKYSVTEGSDGDYFLDHTSSVALLTPQAELRALFSVPLRPARLAKDLLAIVAEDAGAHDAHARDAAARGAAASGAAAQDAGDAAARDAAADAHSAETTTTARGH